MSRAADATVGESNMITHTGSATCTTEAFQRECGGETAALTSNSSPASGLVLAVAAGLSVLGVGDCAEAEPFEMVSAGTAEVVVSARDAAVEVAKVVKAETELGDAANRDRLSGARLLPRPYLN